MLPKIGVGDHHYATDFAAEIAPELQALLQNWFDVSHVYHHVWCSRGDQHDYYDLIGFRDDENGILVQIEPRLSVRKLEAFERKIASYFSFMPRQKGTSIVGLLVARTFDDTMPERVASRGFYLMRSDAKSFALLPTPKDFKARTIKG